MCLEIRESIVAAAQAMLRDGLVTGTEGNVSVRADQPDAMHITPSRVGYSDMTADDIVTVTFEGDPITGERLPSSETLMHAAIYRARPDVRAVIHAHPVFASVLAVRHEAIPPIVDEQVIFAGGGVEVGEYAPAGSEELAASTVKALGPRNAALLANHGSVAVARDAAHALEITRLVERLAQIWYFAAARPGAHQVPDDIVAAEIELFRMMQQAEGE